MSKKLNLEDNKLTFGEANCEAVLPAEAEDLPEVVHVGGEILAKDENVINLVKTELKLTQDEVHHVLKGVPSISEAKEHPQKLIHSKRGDYSHLLDVLRGHMVHK